MSENWNLAANFRSTVCPVFFSLKAAPGVTERGQTHCRHYIIIHLIHARAAFKKYVSRVSIDFLSVGRSVWIVCCIRVHNSEKKSSYWISFFFFLSLLFRIIFILFLSLSLYIYIIHYTHVHFCYSRPQTANSSSLKRAHVDQKKVKSACIINFMTSSDLTLTNGARLISWSFC